MKDMSRSPASGDPSGDLTGRLGAAPDTPGGEPYVCFRTAKGRRLWQSKPGRHRDEDIGHPEGCAFLDA